MLVFSYSINYVFLFLIAHPFCFAHFNWVQQPVCQAKNKSNQQNGTESGM